MIIGGRTFQMGLPSSTVSYWSIESSGLAIAGRASRVLLSDVAGHGGVVVSRVRVGGVDAVHVAVDQLIDHAGENLGVADLEVRRPP